jgi:hypothetical protein
MLTVEANSGHYPLSITILDTMHCLSQFWTLSTVTILDTIHCLTITILDTLHCVTITILDTIRHLSQFWTLYTITILIRCLTITILDIIHYHNSDPLSNYHNSGHYTLSSVLFKSLLIAS